MNSITLKSHAKVNIGLRVLDQREDGYHNIHTIFQELAFHDTVTISKMDDGYELSSNDKIFPRTLPIPVPKPMWQSKFTVLMLLE